MEKMDKLANKLRLLGNKVVVLTTTSLIAKSQSGDFVDCFCNCGDKVVKSRYDSIEPSEIKEDTELLIGKQLDETVLLTRSLDVLMRLKYERIESIVCNKYVVLKNRLTFAFRIATVQGKLISTKNYSSIEIYNIGKNSLLVIGYEVHGQVSILKLNADGIVTNILNELDGVQDKAIGYGLIALKIYNKVKVIDLNGQTRLVVKHGNIRINSKGRETSSVIIEDKFSNVIKFFAEAKKIY